MKRTTTSAYERQWGNVCGPNGRAPGRPERYVVQVDTTTAIDNQSQPVEGSLSKEEVQRGLASARERVAECYDGAVAVWPDVVGKVVVHFIIAPDGTVDSSEIESSEIDRPAFHCCLTSAVATLVFDAPRGGGILSVSYPFVFKATPN